MLHPGLFYWRFGFILSLISLLLRSVLVLFLSVLVFYLLLTSLYFWPGIQITVTFRNLGLLW